MTATDDVDLQRRRLLTGLVRERVVEPAKAACNAVRDDARREMMEGVLESELRAFGPDVMADAAARSGLDTADADYAAVARRLVDRI